MIWIKEQVLTPTWRALVLTVLGVAACACCLLQPRDCTVYLRYDGGATARPYYAVQQCKGLPPKVLCDSPTPLPTATCPTPTGAP